MIECKNLSFGYKRGKRLFSGLSIEIGNGIAGLLGKNGAGKSTLLNLFAGLLAPHEGELNVNGYTPFSRNPNYLADIYVVPEEFVLPPVSINLFVKAAAPLYPRFDRDKLNMIFDEFELGTSYSLNKLSHGQRKKFLIAFALASNCRLLLFDEPTNGLDIPSKSLFRKTLVKAMSEQQTALISTHQVRDIDALLESVVIIDRGAVVFNKTTEDICREYSFETVASPHALENILYQEKCPGGYRVVVPAIDSNSGLDLELLFNAVINNSLTANNTYGYE